MPYPDYADLSAFDPSQQQQLRQFAAYLLGFLSEQHKDDGTHSAITADSVTADDATIDTATITTLNATTIDADTGIIDTINALRATIAPIDGTVNALNVFIPTGGSTGIPITTRAENNVATFDHYAYSGVNPVQRMTMTLAGAPGGASWHAFGTGGVFEWLDNAGATLMSTADMAWTAVTFNAGDFTTSGGGGVPWTLTAPDQTLFRWSLVRKTLFIEFQFDTTTVAAGAPGFLKFKIPNGYTAAQSTAVAGILYSDAGAANAIGFMVTIAGDTNVWLQGGVFGAGTWAAAVNTTNVRGKIWFEVT